MAYKSALLKLVVFSDLQADELQTRADALLARADTIDGLIQSTQSELADKRKEFEHYKNRAQTEMAISLQAEDKEALLRKQAREARFKVSLKSYLHVSQQILAYSVLVP